VNATGKRSSNEARRGMTKTLLAISAMAAALLGGGAVHAQPRDAGFLEVYSDPRAEIVLDDEPTGMWTPQTLALRPGHHKLTLVRLELRPERERRFSTYGFVIEPHHTTRLRIHLAY
jgi:hypothetical protein